MNTRTDLLYFFPKHTIGAEIGVFKGDFSKEIISIVKPKGLYMVDIFTGSMCSGDKDGNNMQYVNLDNIYIDLKKQYEDFKNIQIVKSLSEEFFKQLPDDYLDFVYIDGDHSYDGVKQDLFFARQKVKNLGIIAGHDYTNRFEGVVKAVDEFCTKYNLTKEITRTDGCPSYLIYNKK